MCGLKLCWVLIGSFTCYFTWHYVKSDGEHRWCLKVALHVVAMEGSINREYYYMYVSGPLQFIPSVYVLIVLVLHSLCVYIYTYLTVLQSLIHIHIAVNVIHTK